LAHPVDFCNKHQITARIRNTPTRRWSLIAFVTGKKTEAASSAKLLAAVTDKPMEIIEVVKQNEVVPVGGRDTKEK
jgi:hypothetical protein